MAETRPTPPEHQPDSLREHATRRALSDEATTLELVADTFRGQRRGVAILGIAAGVLLTALLIVCVVQFARAEDVRAALDWGVWLVVALVALALTKLWFWMQIEHYAIVREIKRLDIRLAELTEPRQH
jgi:hypothetical protein